MLARSRSVLRTHRVPLPILSLPTHIPTGSDSHVSECSSSRVSGRVSGRVSSRVSGRVSSSFTPPTHTLTHTHIYTRHMSTSSVVLDTIQQGVIEFHTLTSLPWYASIAASTLLVRFALLPLTRQQMISSHKFAKALPEISLLNELLKHSLTHKHSLNTVAQKKEAVSEYVNGFNAALKIHNVRFSPMIVLPLVNLSVFITFIYAIRGLILYQDFELGGTLWFEDLQDHDSTLILPVIAMTGTYASLELSFRSVEQGSFFAKVKDFMQTGVLMALPVTALLPAGIFCYWIPSTLAITTQMLLLRQPKVQKLLGIPVAHKHSGFRMPDVKEN
jgi:YidC/Oxa1 family membrane protein insertase